MTSTAQPDALRVNLRSTLQVMNTRQRICCKVIKTFVSIIATRTPSATLIVNESCNPLPGKVVGVERLGFAIRIARTLQQEDSGVSALRERYSQRPSERNPAALENDVLFF